MDLFNKWKIKYNKTSDMEITLKHYKIKNSKIYIDGIIIIPKG